MDDAPSAEPLPIRRVAAEAGILPDELDPCGPGVAKLRLGILARVAARPQGALVLVTAMTPTPLGEGKTVTTIGLGLGLHAIGQRAVVTLRQASLGPLLGAKGGGAGGGRARLEPYDAASLHLTGDLHAVGAAHNLLAALADEAAHRGRLDPAALTITRVCDMNDRALRRVRIAVGGPGEREARFEATAASEVMAILALAADAADLKARLARMVVGSGRDGRAVTASDLGATGAMAALLRDALRPNLLQTAEGTPVLVHAGPFANIAHGNSSILADRIALGLADLVVTEAGFGADMGAEKFFNIKCRGGGLVPRAAVVVASVRACKFHGHGKGLKAGARLPVALARPDPALAARGAANLAAQIGIVRLHGVPVLVAINRFPDDTDAEIAAVAEAARAAGAADAIVSTPFADGGAGAAALAARVVALARTPPGFHPLYPLDLPPAEKIRAIATRVYGAADVAFAPAAAEALARAAASPAARWPGCMAKTQYSLSHDPARLGRPTGFTLPVVAVHESAGAGFLVATCGEISTMPGLPATPKALGIDVDAEGRVRGI